MRENRNDGEQRDQGTKEVIQRLYEAVWGMNSARQYSDALSEARKGLEEIGIDFHSCGLYAVDQADEKLVVRYHCMSEEKEWEPVTEETELELVLPIWEKGTAVCWWATSGPTRWAGCGGSGVGYQPLVG